MENNGTLHMTVGTIQKIDDSAIKWTLKDVRKFFEIGECNVFLASPKFQMRGATWNLSLYFKFRDLQKFVCGSLCRHEQGDIRPPSIICHVVVKRGDHNIVDHFFKMSSCDILTSGSITTSDEFLTEYNMMYGDVDVFCTVCQEVEVPKTEELSKDFKEHEKQKAEGLDILSAHMENLYQNRGNCDFVIRVKDKEFQVHRAILSARSPVLAAMLQHDMVEKNSNAVEIVDCEPHTFEQFLLYLYTGRLEELSLENALPLYDLGDKYDMEHLRRVCATQFMGGNLCVEAFCDAFRLRLQQDCTPLIKNAKDFFLENAAEIVVTPKWQLLMKEHPVICNELVIQYIEKNNKDLNIMHGAKRPKYTK